MDGQNSTATIKKQVEKKTMSPPAKIKSVKRIIYNPPSKTMMSTTQSSDLSK